MLAAATPTKVQIVFASGAASGFVRQVPNTSTDPTAASFTLGFPPATGTPVEAGGTPPDIRDENGVLRQISAQAQWAQAGGPIYWDSAFEAAIGGYPLGALLGVVGSVGSFWVNTVDGNTTNPDASGVGWTKFTPIGLGTAAYKATSDNTKATVAAISGAVVLNHLAVFADTAGTLKDGGAIGSQGTAAQKAASDNTQPTLSSVVGGTTTNNFPLFADGNGSIKNSSVGPGSFDASGAAAAAQAGAQAFATAADVVVANNASTDATNKANTAQSNAQTFAAGAANTAQSNSESFATSAVAVETARAEAAEALLAPLNSPHLTNVPTVPTPPPTDNSATIVNSAWVRGLLGSVGLGTPGFITINGLTIQWAIGPYDPADNSEPTHFLDWSKSFPTQCLVAFVSCDLAFTTNSMDSWYQTAGWNTSGVTIQRQRPQNGSFTAQTRGVVIGIGY